MWLFHFVLLGVRLQSPKSSFLQWGQNKPQIPDPDLPIHYTIFMGLRWQLWVVYSGIPNVTYSKNTKSSLGQNFDVFLRKYRNLILI